MKQNQSKPFFKKMINSKFWIAVLLCWIFATNATAQGFDDVELRQHVTLSYRINKNLGIAGKYFLQTDKGITHFNESTLGLEVDYKINKWLKAGIEYRFGTNQYEDANIIRYYLGFDYAINKKWKIKYRPLLQQEFGYLNSEYLAHHPTKYTLRNMLMVQYDLTKKITLYAYTENYTRFKSGDAYFFREKTGVGASYQIKKRHEIELEVDWIKKHNRDNIARIDIGYTFEIGYVKSKKDKTSKPTEATPNAQ